MLPKIFFVTDRRNIYIKYKTKEEFWQIRNVLKRYGFWRTDTSGTRYPKGGMFCVFYQGSLKSKNPLLFYYSTGPNIAYADCTADDFLNFF